MSGRVVARSLVDRQLGDRGIDQVPRDPGAFEQQAAAAVERVGKGSRPQVLDQQQVAELSQPFRRLEADRIGTDEGSGLGLSIVAAIAEAHGGMLDLRARPGGGLRARVDLPAAAATTSAAVPAGARA